MSFPYRIIDGLILFQFYPRNATIALTQDRWRLLLPEIALIYERHCFDLARCAEEKKKKKRKRNGLDWIPVEGKRKSSSNDCSVNIVAISQD